MDELSVFPIAYWVILGVLLILGLTSIIMQIVTIGRWNLAPLYFGSACAMVVAGLMFGSHEMWQAYQQIVQSSGSLKRHVLLADGISTALSIIFVFGLASLAIAAVGSVLAYIREWLFREGMG